MGQRNLHDRPLQQRVPPRRFTPTKNPSPRMQLKSLHHFPHPRVPATTEIINLSKFRHEYSLRDPKQPRRQELHTTRSDADAGRDTCTNTGATLPMSLHTIISNPRKPGGTGIDADCTFLMW